MQAHRSVHTAWGRLHHDREPALAQVGALVWGHVRRIEPYGALIGLDNTRISGLLHISLVSRAHVEDIYVSAPLHLPQDFPLVCSLLMRSALLIFSKRGVSLLVSACAAACV